MEVEVLPIKEKSMQPLTTMQERFCSEYLLDFNGSAAALRAGYSLTTAHNANKLLEKPQIRARILEMNEKVMNKNIATAEEVREFLTQVIRGEVTEQVPIFVGGGIQQFKDKDITIKDRVKAAELLGKSYALFTDKQSVDIQIPVVISGDHLLED